MVMFWCGVVVAGLGAYFVQCISLTAFGYSLAPGFALTSYSQLFGQVIDTMFKSSNRTSFHLW